MNDKIKEMCKQIETMVAHFSEKEKERLLIKLAMSFGVVVDCRETFDGESSESFATIYTSIKLPE